MTLQRVIELNHLSWTVGERHILQGIDWTVKKGEHWVILGLNGSGKTSLMKMINAYAAPSSGTLRVLGQTYGRYDWRQMRKRIGFVSSSLTDSLYATETALEITMSGLFATIGLYDHATKEEEEKALSMLSKLTAAHLANEPYSTLSQGERQRALIARALINSPKILILDEPCEGLDVMAREAVLDSLASLAQTERHPTLVYVTHRAEEILPVFTHALLLKDGKAFSKGKVSEVISPDTLSRFYGQSTEVLWKNGRPWVTF